MSEEHSHHEQLAHIQRALFELRHDQMWLVDRVMDLTDAVRGSFGQFTDVASKLDAITAGISRLSTQEAQNMAIGQDILAKVTAESTVIGSIKTYIDSLVGNTIDQATADAINAQLTANDAALAAAIPANTPVAP